MREVKTLEHGPAEDLPDNDEFTLNLITNEEVLAVDQKASQSKELFTKENQVAWTAVIAGSR